MDRVSTNIQLFQTTVQNQILNENQQVLDDSGDNIQITTVPKPNQKKKQKQLKFPIITKDSAYDKEAIPANWEFAQRHAQCWKVGQFQNNDEEVHEKCPCCGRHIGIQQLNLNCETIDLDFLGPGFPLYFEFIKYSILMLLVLLLSSGTFNIVTNVLLGTNCLDPEKVKELVDDGEDPQSLCVKGWATTPSLVNKRKNKILIQGQELMNLFSVFSIIVVLQYFRKSQREVDSICDTSNIQATDYTVVIKNLPLRIPDKDYDQALKAFLEQYAGVEVAQINLAYNPQQLQLYRRDKLHAVEKKQTALEYKKQKGKWPDGVTESSLEHEIRLRTQLVQNLLLKYEQNEDMELIQKYFTGVAFVSLQYEKQKSQLIEKNNISDSLFRQLFWRQTELFWAGHYLFIEEAANPTNVFWENLHVKTSTQYYQRLVSLLLTVLTICVCIVLITLLQIIQDGMIRNSPIVVDPNGKKSTVQTTQTKVLGAFLGILVQIINYILISTLKWSAGFEAYSTRTLYNASIAVQSTISLFFNTALLNFFMKIVYVYFTQNSVKASENIYRPHGLVQSQQMILISNAIIPNIVYLIDAGRIAKYVERWWEKRKGINNTLTQQEANILMEEPQFDIAVRYPIIVNAVFVAAFYAPLIPIALIYGCLGLTCIYWSERYKILRQRTIKYNVSTELSVEMTELLEAILPIYCISNVFFEFFLGNTQNGEIRISKGSILGIVISIAHMVLPMQAINEKIFHVQPPAENQESYFQVESKFTSDYDRENPVTKRRARLLAATRKAINLNT